MMEQVQAQMQELLRVTEQAVRLMTVWDIVDIVIVAYAIYRLLLFIRKSRSGQVAKAIVILIAATLVISTFGHLKVINFILSSAMELGLIALAIVFQPELRRFLERMGSGKIKEMFASEVQQGEEESAILETVAAYTSLSRDKVGALMVFERKTLLDDVIKTGTTLDCGVNAQLLKNLFWNKAPLHDGAVIVRGGRIVGAGCMLPLSGNGNLSRDLGMRHRAGIGMSENSDAVVAIVSEETGSISVAINGMLKRHLTAETLERLLRNELLKDNEGEAANAAVKLTGRLKKKGDKADGKEAAGQ